MAKAYRGRLFSLSARDEKAIEILQLELAERGYAPSRSAALRFALHETVRGLIADTAGLARIPSPANIAAATPGDLPGAPDAGERAG